MPEFRKDMSNLHEYSIGIVHADNPDNEFVIKIAPVERLLIEDDFVTMEQPKKVKLSKIGYKPPEPTDKQPNLKNNTEDIEHTHTNWITATWYNTSCSNRHTPPNVCKGEFVRIYRYGNSDLFFWDTANTKLKHRKEERVTYVYKDNPEHEDTEVNIEDHYYVEIAPKDKRVKLHTTDKYGELTTYDITLDTKAGYVELKDGKGNYFKLNSAEDTYTINLNKDVIENISNNKVITLSKIAIQNDTTELISLLSEYLQTHIEEQHIGNLGIPTNLTGDFISKYTDIKSRLDTLKI